MESQLTIDQLKWLGFGVDEQVAYLDAWKFTGGDPDKGKDIYFDHFGKYYPTLLEIFEAIYNNGKEAGAAEKVEDIKAKL